MGVSRIRRARWIFGPGFDRKVRYTPLPPLPLKALLGARSGNGGRQNLDVKELAGKIQRTKDLEVAAGALRSTPGSTMITQLNSEGKVRCHTRAVESGCARSHGG
jgi:hypothetical protein